MRPLIHNNGFKKGKDNLICFFGFVRLLSKSLPSIYWGRVAVPDSLGTHIVKSLSFNLGLDA